MHSPPDSENEFQRVRLELIDPSTWRPLNHWIFENKELITIGRSQEQDAPVSDPVVSRHHASLVLRGSQWFLLSTGRHGVMVLDKLITECLATSGMHFRLGPHGPTLKFSIGMELEDVRATYNFEDQPKLQDSVDEFELDKAKLEREVNEIADSEYFQHLQRMAKEMRDKRKRRHD